MKLNRSINLLAAGGLLTIATVTAPPAHADDWVTVNPDGSTTRTQIKNQGGVNTFSTAKPNPYGLTAPELVELPDSNPALRVGDVVDSEALNADVEELVGATSTPRVGRAATSQRVRRDSTVSVGRGYGYGDGGGRSGNRRTSRRFYSPENPSPYYPSTGYSPYGYPNVYTYPNYGNTYVLPAPVYSGPLGPSPFPGVTPPWITTIPLGTTATPHHHHHHSPGYGYPATQYPPAQYPLPQYPQVGYPAGTVVVPGSYYPYGTGYGTNTQSFGTFSYSNGGIGITIGGGRTTTSTTTTIHGNGVFGR